MYSESVCKKAGEALAAGIIGTYHSRQLAVDVPEDLAGDSLSCAPETARLTDDHRKSWISVALSHIAHAICDHPNLTELQKEWIVSSSIDYLTKKANLGIGITDFMDMRMLYEFARDIELAEPDWSRYENVLIVFWMKEVCGTLMDDDEIDTLVSLSDIDDLNGDLIEEGVDPDTLIPTDAHFWMYYNTAMAEAEHIPIKMLQIAAAAPTEEVLVARQVIASVPNNKAKQYALQAKYLADLIDNIADCSLSETDAETVDRLIHKHAEGLLSNGEFAEVEGIWRSRQKPTQPITNSQGEFSDSAKYVGRAIGAGVFGLGAWIATLVILWHLLTGPPDRTVGVHLIVILICGALAVVWTRSVFKSIESAKKGDMFL